MKGVNHEVGEGDQCSAAAEDLLNQRIDEVCSKKKKPDRRKTMEKPALKCAEVVKMSSSGYTRDILYGLARGWQTLNLGGNLGCCNSKRQDNRAKTAVFPN